MWKEGQCHPEDAHVLTQHSPGHTGSADVTRLRMLSCTVGWPCEVPGPPVRGGRRVQKELCPGKQREEGGKGGTRSPRAPAPLEAERKEEKAAPVETVWGMQPGSGAWFLGLDFWNQKIRVCCL